MVTASREYGKPITRNSSFFKHATSGKIPFIDKSESKPDILEQEEFFNIFEQDTDLKTITEDNNITINDNNEVENEVELDEFNFEFMNELGIMVNNYDSNSDDDYELPNREVVSEDYSTDSKASDTTDQSTASSSVTSESSFSESIFNTPDAQTPNTSTNLVTEVPESNELYKLCFTNNSGDGNDALILEQNKSGGLM